MSGLSNNEKLQLQKMINESECDDNTSQIRELKHSILLRDNIRKLDTFRKANIELQKTNYNEFVNQAKDIVPFLYNSYTDIFNRITKDELDLEIMTKLLIVLKMIEDDKINQHEGSVMVGKVLKELYVDSALKRGENLDEQYKSAEPTPKEHGNISWKEYKKLHMK
jgi:hypothetical protein|uniref:Uncharacterized protein n=1 Tax=viral metagenome TaxID=1070528 RepID=A0A6C0FC37_9ZZZZ|tara:strand:- start:34751 stop:35248 length:498 start_codon:yes stop_codon:yes gene_type:complete